MPDPREIMSELQGALRRKIEVAVDEEKQRENLKMES